MYRRFFYLNGDLTYIFDVAVYASLIDPNLNDQDTSSRSLCVFPRAFFFRRLSGVSLTQRNNNRGDKGSSRIDVSFLYFFSGILSQGVATSIIRFGADKLRRNKCSKFPSIVSVTFRDAVRGGTRFQTNETFERGILWNFGSNDRYIDDRRRVKWRGFTPFGRSARFIRTYYGPFFGSFKKVRFSFYLFGNDRCHVLLANSCDTYGFLGRFFFTGVTSSILIFRL